MRAAASRVHFRVGSNCDDRVIVPIVSSCARRAGASLGGDYDPDTPAIAQPGMAYATTAHGHRYALRRPGQLGLEHVANGDCVCLEQARTWLLVRIDQHDDDPRWNRKSQAFRPELRPGEE
jgi:hypothetical protein